MACLDDGELEKRLMEEWGPSSAKSKYSGAYEDIYDEALFSDESVKELMGDLDDSALVGDDYFDNNGSYGSDLDSREGIDEGELEDEFEDVYVDDIDTDSDVIEVYDENGELIGTYSESEFERIRQSK